MKLNKITSIVLASAAALLALPAALHADPLPNETLKFSQLPEIGTAIPNSNGTVGIFNGHDELSTIVATYIPGTNTIANYNGTYMADDFADQVSTPIVHITFWGSYLGNPITVPSVQKFLIALETDVPVSTANTFSHPGSVIASEIVNAGPLAPNSGTFTETPAGNSLDGPVFKYNAELKNPFPETKDTIYWLKIVALDDANAANPPLNWGWHDRDFTIKDNLASTLASPGEFVEGTLPGGGPIWHFQDDAISGRMIFDPNITTNFGINQPVPAMFPQNYVDNVDGPGAITPGFPGMSTFSKDLAFQLYTTPVPEPTSLTLLALATPALLLRRRK